jgi:hypothetical protein
LIAWDENREPIKRVSEDPSQRFGNP